MEQIRVTKNMRILKVGSSSISTKKESVGILANIVSDLQIDLGKINILLLDPPVQEQSVPLLL